MATIEPREASPAGSRSLTVTWVGMSAGDDIRPHAMTDYSGIAGSLQIVTSGAVVGLQVSNNGDDWVDVEDEDGEIGFSESTMLEFSITAQMIRPTVASGGPASAFVVLRG